MLSGFAPRALLADGSGRLRALAGIRLWVGLGLLARPNWGLVALGADRRTATRLSWVMRMVGARELTLGGGALLHPGDRSWAGAGAISDALDAAIAVLALRSHQLPRVRGALAALSAAGGASVATRDLVRGT